MTTNKALYFGSTQVGFDVASVATAGYTRTRNILDLDWGEAPAEIFTRPRALRDGSIRRGRRHGERQVSMRLATRITPQGLTAAQVEAARDDEWGQVLDLLYPEQGLVTLKQTRLDYAAAAISRQIRGELVGVPAWTWSPDDVGDGLVGLPQHPLAVMPLLFNCPFPWFEDASATADVSLQTLDGTLRSASISNGGLVTCGLRIEITATSGGPVTVVIANSTAPAVAGISGFTLTGISPTATAVVVDWFCTNPLAWSVTQSTTDLTDKLSTVAGIGLSRGANTITWQVTSGSLTGGKISISHRNLWGQP